jgi:hypothetical protein
MDLLVVEHHRRPALMLVARQPGGSAPYRPRFAIIHSRAQLGLWIDAATCAESGWW